MRSVEPSTTGRWSSLDRTGATGTSARTSRCPFRLATGPTFDSPTPTRCEAPDFALVLDGVNVGGRGADLAFGKTISFEFGARHAFSDDMVLDMAVYNHDNLALASARTFLVDDPVAAAQEHRRSGDERGFRECRGVDLRLDRRFGDVFNGTISYTYQTGQEYRRPIRWTSRIEESPR